MPDDEQPDGQEPDSSSGDGGDLEQRVGRIEAAVAQLLARDGTPDPETGDETTEPPARRTIRDEESHIEHLVRQASAKIHGEEEAEARLAALEKKLETAPTKVRRSTRLTWGEP